MIYIRCPIFMNQRGSVLWKPSFFFESLRFHRKSLLSMFSNKKKSLENGRPSLAWISHHCYGCCYCRYILLTPRLSFIDFLYLLRPLISSNLPSTVEKCSIKPNVLIQNASSENKWYKTIFDEFILRQPWTRGKGNNTMKKNLTWKIKRNYFNKCSKQLRTQLLLLLFTGRLLTKTKNYCRTKTMIKKRENKIPINGSLLRTLNTNGRWSWGHMRSNHITST